MTYHITCLCGHRFAVPDSALNRHIACPACNRALIPVSATSAPEVASIPVTTPTTPVAPSPTAPTAEPTKRCPFCGEVILAVAKKCRFCNEYLDRSPPPSGGVALTKEPDKADTPPTFILAVSQWDNFFRYVICASGVILTGLALYGIADYRWQAIVKPYANPIFLIVAMLALITATFFYLANRSSRCTIWPTRIETEIGIFAKQVDALEMFRITDINLRQNLLQRLLGIGTVELRSTDPTTPLLELYMIPKARKVYRYIQEQVPKADKNRGVIRVEK